MCLAGFFYLGAMTKKSTLQFDLAGETKGNKRNNKHNVERERKK